MSAGAGWGPMIEAGFWDEPGVIELGYGDSESRSALLVLLELRSWSMTTGTDGVIPRRILRRATAHHDPERAMEHLVEAGLAEVTGDGWEIDWSTQIPAEEVSSIRGKWAARKRHYRGNHTDCATWGIKGCDKVSHETSTKTSTVESHPIREGKETEEKRREEKGSEAKSSSSPSGSSPTDTPRLGARAGGARPDSVSEEAGEPVARVPRRVVVE